MSAGDWTMKENARFLESVLEEVVATSQAIRVSKAFAAQADREAWVRAMGRAQDTLQQARVATLRRAMRRARGKR